MSDMTQDEIPNSVRQTICRELGLDTRGLFETFVTDSTTGREVSCLVISSALTRIFPLNLMCIPSAEIIIFEPGSRMTELQAGTFGQIQDTRIIRIPPSVVSIGSGCFTKQLESLTFEPGSQLVRIAPEAFAGCDRLKSVCIPATVREMTGATFAHSALEKIEIEDGNPDFRVVGDFLLRGEIYLVRYFGASNEPTLDDRIEVLGCHSFGYLKTLTTVNFSQTSKLVKIESNAFLQCEHLTTITVPPLVEIIEPEAFHSCTALLQISFAGSKLTRIGSEGFGRCLYLQGISIPPSVEVIETRCFTQCTRLAAVNLPPDSRLMRIETGLFHRCTNLASLCVPASIEVIGELCFRCCNALIELSFAGGSRLRELLDLPPRWGGVCEIPDSVILVNVSSQCKGPGQLVMKFGRDSKVDRVRIRVKPGNVARRTFLEVPPGYLKSTRSAMEFWPFPL
jgi:hypothetical protein